MYVKLPLQGTCIVGYAEYANAWHDSGVERHSIKIPTIDQEGVSGALH